MELFNKKKISVIVEKVFSNDVVQVLESSGVSGYTIYTRISGKGRHGTRDGHTEFTGGIFGNVEIVTVVGDEIADRILEKLVEMLDKGVVMIVHVTEVKVLRSEYFA